MEVANRAIWVVAKSAINESFLPTSTTQPLSRLSIDGVHQSWNERRALAVPADVYQRSFDYGTTLGNAIVAWAATDGFSSNNNPPYTPPTGPGLWAPTPPLYQRALQPTWGNLRTFVLASADECAPPPPTPFSTVPGSPFYLENLEVYDAVNNLSPEQKEIAIFWSDDPGVTATPPGHWISIVTLLVQRDALPLGLAAEAYARVGLAVADAFISCWRAKYVYNLLRPTTYIRDYIDGDWLPLLGTPPFPEYSSGHSTQSGAVAVVLTDLLGTVSFVDTTHSARGLPPRAFLSFMQAAEEAAISRLYGGIHYRPAIDNGVDQGVCIGQAVVDRVQFGS
jgi:membrane-associated phospholipid phosphatase